MEPVELMNLALVARKNAYAPYSGVQVGAALLCADGTVYTGCNIENAAFGPTVCAERTAIFKAVSDGKRQFSAIAVCGGKGEQAQDPFPPCGVCRQVMGEFCGDEFLILTMDGQGGLDRCTLGELLPFRFSSAHT